MGLGADLTLVGRDLILVLLGPRWEESGRIFIFFGPGIGMMLLYFTHGWIHLSIGRADRWCRWGLVEFMVTGLLFLLGLRWGPRGIAVAWVVSFWVLTIPALWFARRPTGMGIGPVVSAVWKYVVASALAGFACAAITLVLPLSDGVTSRAAAGRIAIVSVVFGALYAGAVIALHGGLAPLQQAVRLLRDMIPSSLFSRPSFATNPLAAAGTNAALAPTTVREAS
jgi:PST family polysaccharide transporter